MSNPPVRLGPDKRNVCFLGCEPVPTGKQHVCAHCRAAGHAHLLLAASLRPMSRPATSDPALAALMLLLLPLGLRAHLNPDLV